MQKWRRLRRCWSFTPLDPNKNDFFFPPLKTRFLRVIIRNNYGGDDIRVQGIGFYGVDTRLVNLLQAHGLERSLNTLLASVRSAQVGSERDFLHLGNQRSRSIGWTSSRNFEFISEWWWRFSNGVQHSFDLHSRTAIYLWMIIFDSWTWRNHSDVSHRICCLSSCGDLSNSFSVSTDLSRLARSSANNSHCWQHVQNVHCDRWWRSDGSREIRRTTYVKSVSLVVQMRSLACLLIVETSPQARTVMLRDLEPIQDYSLVDFPDYIVKARTYPTIIRFYDSREGGQ